MAIWIALAIQITKYSHKSDYIPIVQIMCAYAALYNWVFKKSESECPSLLHILPSKIVSIFDTFSSDCAFAHPLQ